ncbi:hypothetical protein P3342_000620 [Pyrenophora teres f. teres]|nr:hypothetical protein P3342_000620 [Pyrenophora teres f. teres]
MLGKSLLRLFCLPKSDEKPSSRFYHEDQPTMSDEANASQSSAIKFHQYPLRYLPHTVIRSDLGYRDHKFKLQFNRFLAEDPSIAVFSVDQEAPVSSTWRDERSRNHCRLSSKYGRARLLLTGRSHCNATITVGNEWPFRVSMKGIRYWNVEDGVLLVDWGQLYASYFARTEKRLNRRKDGEDIEVDRSMERNMLESDSEEARKTCGDCGIVPAAHEELVMAHKHTVQGIHSSFRWTRVQQDSQGANGVVKKQVDERWKIHKRVESFVCSPGPLWRTSGYQQLG